MEYYKAKSGLNTIAERITTNVDQLATAGRRINRVVGDLTNMQTDYSSFVQEIDQMAADNPGDTVWQEAKAEKDKLVAEFQAAKATAEAKKTAFDNA